MPTRIALVSNGTLTVLTSASITWNNGDIIELEVEGSALRGFKSGVVVLSTWPWR